MPKLKVLTFLENIAKSNKNPINKKIKFQIRYLLCFNSAKSSSTTEITLEWGSQEGSGSHNCVIFSKANHRSRVDIPLAPLGYRELSLLAKAKKARKRRRGKLWSPSPLSHSSQGRNVFSPNCGVANWILSSDCVIHQ